MSLFAKQPKDMDVHEMYRALVEVQTELLNKKIEQKTELEAKGNYGLEHTALVNEINTINKNLNALRLFQSANNYK